MSITVYRTLTSAVWVVARPWFLWKRARGGTEWRERLGDLPASSPGTLWVHAASVGEVSAASPLVRALSLRGAPVLLTVMTPTGRRVASRLEGDLVNVAFPPLDFVAPVGEALGRVAPRALLLVETELWPNLISSAAARGVSVGIVNGRISERSLRRYRLPGFPLASIREAVTFVACRSGKDAERFVLLGFPPERVMVVGDTKFDAVGARVPDSERERLRSLLAARDSDVVVFGSVRPQEERAVVDAATAARREAGARVVVAPRHMSRVGPVTGTLSSAGLSTCTWSGLVSGSEDAEDAVVLDTTGDLSALYSAADVAFVGGTLAPYGGHNLLEPAAQGVPVVFGRHTESCDEAARLLISTEAATLVADAADLRRVVLEMLEDVPGRAAMGTRALQAVESRRGAVERTVGILESHGILQGPRTPEVS